MQGKPNQIVSRLRKHLCYLVGGGLCVVVYVCLPCTGDVMQHWQALLGGEFLASDASYWLSVVTAASKNSEKRDKTQSGCLLRNLYYLCPWYVDRSNHNHRWATVAFDGNVGTISAVSVNFAGL